MSPRRYWDSSTPSLASVCATRVRGWGSPNSDDWRKLSTLPTLWVGERCSCLVSAPVTFDYVGSKEVSSGSFLTKKFLYDRMRTRYRGMCIRFQFIRTVQHL